MAAVLCALASTPENVSVASEIAAPVEHFELHIQRASLTDALRRIGEQTHLQIARFSDVEPANLMVGPLTGSYTREEALNALLRGTGLTYRFVNDHTVAIVKETLPPVQSAPPDAPAAPMSRQPLAPNNQGEQNTTERKDVRGPGADRVCHPGVLGRLLGFLALCSRAGVFAIAHITGAYAASPQESSADSVQTAPAADDRNTTIEQIVVTAQKRSEKVQDIPKTVEVLSQSALTQGGVSNIQDLNLVSTSIQGSTFNATSPLQSPPAIRGITSFAYSIGVQAQTGIVLDDVPLPNFSTLADELTDVQRVEVLPGPQSTLSGRNAAGGLINIVTRDPSDALKASITTELTDDRQRRVAGYVTGPLNERFGFSLSGYWDEWDGPLRNLVTGDRFGGYDRSGARAKLLFHPTDSLRATLTAYYTYNDAKTQALTGGYTYVGLTGAALTYFTGPATLRSLISPVSPGPYNTNIYSYYQGKQVSHDAGGTLRLEYDSLIGTIASITSYSQSVAVTRTPLAAFQSFPDLPVQQDYTVDSLTQEVRLTSPQSDSRLQYLLGLIYSDTKIHEPYARALIAPVDWDRRAGIDSVALYSHLTYAVLPHTFATAGLRLQHDDLSYDWSFLDGSAPPSHGSSTYNFPAGEVSLRQEFGSDVSLYVTYANGQTGRAYDLENSSAASTPAGLSPLKSERVHSIEGGIKSQWLDNRLTLNTAIFDAHYSDYQIQSAYFAGPGSLAVIQLLSIGRVESRGVELDGRFAVTPDLAFNAGATFLDAVIRDYPNAPCYTGQTVPAACLSFGGLQGNLAGTDMPGASRIKATASVAYTLRLPTLPFDATFDARYRNQSAFHTNLYNDPASRIGGYGILNLAAGIQTHRAGYTLQFFVNNVFDKRYYASLDRDPVVFDPSGGNPASVVAAYARDSSRYAGVRLSADY